jgi:tRNA pseudouridine13 synthase
MRWPEGHAAELEREALAELIDDPARLDAFSSYGEGARRALRLWVHELEFRREGDDALVVSFVLTKGGYATTVLSRACTFVDASLARSTPLDDAEPKHDESSEAAEG